MTGIQRQLPKDKGGHERRFVVLDRAKFRADEDGDGPDGPFGFTGHAAVFASETLIGSRQWGFVEEVASGAFADVLEDDVRFLHNHDPNYVLARTTNKTLRLAEDKVGLDTDADLAPTSYGKDLRMLLERGDVNQMSFAFDVGKDEWEILSEDHPTYPGMDKRTIISFRRLYDVSTVTYPAYDDTDAALRAAIVVSEADVREQKQLLIARSKLEQDWTRRLPTGALRTTE